MVKIGDLIKCPKCGNYGRVVWVSKGQKSAGVRCSSRHMFTPKLHLDLTSIERGKGRFERNMVFLVKI
jgi:hypothetical protein